mmetsp:Transcript_17761/g.41354  ORF Transcript_17761/g.41354 Transcript_17761/m.41354 type:complete len:278 (+) Transcript_17761:520-1353(+)
MLVVVHYRLLQELRSLRRQRPQRVVAVAGCRVAIPLGCHCRGSDRRCCMLTEQLVVHSQTMVRQRTALTVSAGLAYPQEVPVGLDRLLVLAEVVPQDSEREVGPAFLSQLRRPPAREDEVVEVLNPVHDRGPFFRGRRLVVWASLRHVEEGWEIYALRLQHAWAATTLLGCSLLLATDNAQACESHRRGSALPSIAGAAADPTSYRGCAARGRMQRERARANLVLVLGGVRHMLLEPGARRLSHVHRISHAASLEGLVQPHSRRPAYLTRRVGVSAR